MLFPAEDQHSDTLERRQQLSHLPGVCHWYCSCIQKLGTSKSALDLCRRVHGCEIRLNGEGLRLEKRESHRYDGQDQRRG